MKTTKTKSVKEMTLEEKLNFIFSSCFIRIGNHVMRHDGDWVDAFSWAHVQLPGEQHIAGESRFLKLDDCLDNCIEYLKELKKKNKSE